ncbi:oleosin-like [Rutidosis leptorrhynchoides]|uniref:oleosin-like n=1 Tax=Rutidosis leptorrhynchoides TaxID=125765 RepID=UPI003A99703C
MATTYSSTFDRQQYPTTTQTHYRFDHAGNRYPYPQQHQQHQGPSSSKVMAIMALLPVGAILLGLAGITLVGTVIGLAVATPLFIIFSPVIVPAVLTIGLAVTGFLTSGTFGLTGLSSLSYLVSMLRQSAPSIPEQMDYVKEKIQDVGEYAGQKTKDVGQTIQNKAHEMGEQGGQGQVHGQSQGHVGVGGGEVNVQAGGKEGGKEGGKKGGKGGGGSGSDRA